MIHGLQYFLLKVSIVSVAFKIEYCRINRTTYCSSRVYKTGCFLLFGRTPVPGRICYGSN
jgi:hypothetical protein